MRLRTLVEQQRHRRDEIVQPLIIVEGADEADHIRTRESKPLRRRAIRRERAAEQAHVDAVRSDDDLAASMPRATRSLRSPSQITATASA
jgi:hypothetical protein